MHEAERSNKEDYHRVRREQAAGHTERLSQSPCAIFESVFSGQGVTRTMSAHLINSICRVGSPCVIPVMDVEMQKFILKLLCTHKPLVLIRPYAFTCLDHVRTVAGRKQLFRCNHLYFDILALLLHVQCEH